LAIIAPSTSKLTVPYPSSCLFGGKAPGAEEEAAEALAILTSYIAGSTSAKYLE